MALIGKVYNPSLDNPKESNNILVSEPLSKVPFSTTRSNSFETIVIDGKEFPLTRSGLVEEDMTMTIESGDKVVHASGSNYKYVRFGAASWYGDKTAQHSLFVIGDVTPARSVPTSGVAVYTGRSVQDSTPIGVGGAVFEVDFGKKVIQGYVKPLLVDALELSGTINGSSFSGTKNGVEMRGNFYGPQAQELGGAYKGTTINGSYKIEHAGVFGAKKQ